MIDGSIPNDPVASAEQLCILEQRLIALESRGPGEVGVGAEPLLQAARAVVEYAGQCTSREAHVLARRTERAVATIASAGSPLDAKNVTVILRALDGLRTMLAGTVAGENRDIAGLLHDLASISTRMTAKSPRRAVDRRLRALLVEDDFTSRLLMQTFLARYGECHVAVNGKEAVAAFRKALENGCGYDLICMDIMMPEMDGGEAVRLIRTIEEARGTLPAAGARIIMTTAVNNLKEVALCFRNLCDAYLVKPIDLARLLDYLRAYGLAAETQAQPLPANESSPCANQL